jgi:hypothetical protein
MHFKSIQAGQVLDQEILQTYKLSPEQKVVMINGNDFKAEFYNADLVVPDNKHFTIYEFLQ